MNKKKKAMSKPKQIHETINKSPLLSTPQAPRSKHAHSSSKKFPTTPKSSNNSTTRTALNVSDGEHRTSKTQDKQKRETKVLQDENEELKAELTYIKSLYKQLIDEAPSECFDERRVNLLKSQVIQLERQVALQSWALNARTDMLTEVEGQLLNIMDHLRSLQVQSDVSTYSRISDLLSTIDGTRHYLFKTVEGTNPDILTLPAIYMGKFLKSNKTFGSQQELTLMDVCSGKLEHLNLRHVSKLETKLCKLYKQLLRLKEFIQPPNKTLITSSVHIGKPIRDHLDANMQTTRQMLEESCQDLLSLSVLFPAAPWPPLTKHIRPDLTLDNIMAHMPSGLNRRKEDEIRSVIGALMKTVSYNQHMYSIEIKIFREELSFHQRTYQLQLDYTESVLSSVRTAYTEFEKTTSEMLCEPLEKILEHYDNLRTTTSEEDLRLFLTAFKVNSPKIADAIECLQTHRNDGATDLALSQCSQNFLESLNVLTRECAATRDELMSKLLDIKQNERETQLDS